MRTWVRTLVRPAFASVAIALGLICLAVVLVEYRARAQHFSDLRAAVYDRATYVTSKLEGHVNGDLQLIRGLTAAVAADPTMSQERFSAFAASLMQTSDRLTHIAAAPGLVVSMVYPLAGNEKALGLDYLMHPGQRDAVLKARDTGKLVLAGPVDLVQGGKGLIGRFPVFVDTHEGRRFWGIVSAVIDIDAVYAASGLIGQALPIEVAIVRRDTPAVGEPFFGAPELLGKDPVIVEARFPSTSWLVHAIPKGGWDQTSPYIWQARGLLFIASILILVPIVATGRLIEEQIGRAHV